MVLHDQNTSTLYNASAPERLLELIKRRIQELSDAQNDVASARRDLLVRRETVRTTSRKVRLIRMEVGNAEATLMNLLREFSIRNNGEFSDSLRDAYEKVEQTRTHLGDKEADYLQMERDLTGAEWVFMDRETSFYQLGLQVSIPEDWIVTSQQPLPVIQSTPFRTFSNVPLNDLRLMLDTKRPATPRYDDGSSSDWSQREVRFDITATRRDLNTVLAELGAWHKSTQTLRQEQAKRIEESEGPESIVEISEIPFATLSSHVTAYCDARQRTTELENEAQRLQIEEANEVIKTSMNIHACVERPQIFEDFKTSTRAMDRAYTEGYMTVVSRDFKSGRRICGWLLDGLNRGALQPWLYENISKAWGIANPESYANRDQVGDHWSSGGTGSENSFGNDLDSTSVCSDPGPKRRNHIRLDRIKLGNLSSSKAVTAGQHEISVSSRSKELMPKGTQFNETKEYVATKSYESNQPDSADLSTTTPLPSVPSYSTKGTMETPRDNVVASAVNPEVQRAQSPFILRNQDNKQRKDSCQSDKTGNSRSSTWSKYRPTVMLRRILRSQ